MFRVRTQRYGLPRARGDQPSRGRWASVQRASSPRARGSTLDTACGAVVMDVFPARAGINLTRGRRSTARTSLPRARGDQPFPWLMAHFEAMSSPRARGSTLQLASDDTIDWVFPARAGINRPPALQRLARSGLPRARGDQPGHACATRGTHGLPRARGDQPLGLTVKAGEAKSSPRARGSTAPAGHGRGVQCVFPARAGINRGPGTRTGGAVRLPRARGDQP